MDLSNTGRLTITGGLRCDSLIKVGNDTVALKSDLEGLGKTYYANNGLNLDGDTFKLQVDWWNIYDGTYRDIGQVLPDGRFASIDWDPIDGNPVISFIATKENGQEIRSIYDTTGFTIYGAVTASGLITSAGLRCDSSITVAGDTVVTKNDTVTTTKNGVVTPWLRGKILNTGNTLVGSQSIKIKGDSVALGDTIFKPMINIVYKENTLNQENYAYGKLSLNQYNYVDNDTSSNISNETIGYMSHNQQNYTTGVAAYNQNNSTSGADAYNQYNETSGIRAIPTINNSIMCDTLALFEKKGVVKTKITSYGIETNALITPYDTLASTATVITYDAHANPFRTDTIGESHTYHINGAVNGSKGMLNVTITSTATLTFPSGVLADGQTFTSLAEGVYNVCWEKVQNTFNYNIHKYVTYTP
jgi:hypothetical protein